MKLPPQATQFVVLIHHICKTRENNLDFKDFLGAVASLVSSLVIGESIGDDFELDYLRDFSMSEEFESSHIIWKRKGVELTPCLINYLYH